jgi:excisionase family DNA binding protein
MKKLLLTSEVANLLRLSEEHVRLLLRKRQLKGYKEGRKSGYRIPESEVLRYINFKMKMEEKKHTRKAG